MKNGTITRILTIAVLLAILGTTLSTVGATAPSAMPLQAGATETPAPAAYEPVTIEHCGISFTYEQPPERVVTMNQEATEVMLALGLQDHMVGTAYLDDAILPEYQETYETIPVLSEKYPSQEVILGVEPDLIYASMRSAFNEKAAGTREQLQQLGINSYLPPYEHDCESEMETDMGEGMIDTMDDIYLELLEVGRIFGVEERAQTLVDAMKTDVAEVQAKLATVSEEPVIFWYDSGTDEPFVGAGDGMPNYIIEAVGGTNLFADLEGGWQTANWERVLDADPDVIVLIDAVWSTADEKIQYLKNHPALSDLTAVKAERFVVIPFSYTYPGFRSAAGIHMVAEGLYPELFVDEAAADEPTAEPVEAVK